MTRKASLVGINRYPDQEGPARLLALPIFGHSAG